MNETDVGTVARLLDVEPEGVALLLTHRVTVVIFRPFFLCFHLLCNFRCCSSVLFGSVSYIPLLAIL